MPYTKRCKKPAARRTAPQYRVGSLMRCYENGYPISAGRYNELAVERCIELVSEKSAEWVNNYKAIRMFARKEIRTDQSYVLTVGFMHHVSEGDKYALRLLSMMNPRAGRKDLIRTVAA